MYERCVYWKNPLIYVHTENDFMCSPFSIVCLNSFYRMAIAMSLWFHFALFVKVQFQRNRTERLPFHTNQTDAQTLNSNVFQRCDEQCVVEFHATIAIVLLECFNCIREVYSGMNTIDCMINSSEHLTQ